MDLVLHPFVGILLSLYLDLNFVELLLVLAFSAKKQLFLTPRFDRMERSFAAFSRRRGLCLALAFAVPIVLRIAMLPWHPVPEPWIPDEFSHLLLGDTFSHGRLVNETHPLWQHFESIHEIFVPKYASIYFPGLGLVLALGEILGHPWIGVLLSAGAMCAALLWMLYGFFPPRWALLGGVLAVARWGTISYWVNSYWGGTAAALGGALALGAYARLKKRATVSSAITLGLGLVMMAYTRPLEGFVLAIPIVLAALWPYRKFARWRELSRIAIPVSVVAGVGLLALAYYFRAITGSFLQMPYRVNQALYGWPLTLPWDHARTVAYRHNELQNYFQWERCVQMSKTFPWQFLNFFTLHLQPLWAFFLGPALTFPVFLAHGFWANRRIRLPLVGAALSLALAMVIAAYPHYIAPATGCFLAISVQSIRSLAIAGRDSGRESERESERNHSRNSVGVAWSRIVVLVCVIMLPVRTFIALRHLPGMSPGNHVFSAFGSDPGQYRYKAARKLAQTPDAHLVFVQYHRTKYNTTEWVYNEADIDHAKVIWVFDMGPEKNGEVLRYYPRRKAWLARPDDAPGELTIYSPALSRADTPGPLSPRICPADN